MAHLKTTPNLDSHVLDMIISTASELGVEFQLTPSLPVAPQRVSTVEVVKSDELTEKSEKKYLEMLGQNEKFFLILYCLNDQGQFDRATSFTESFFPGNAGQVFILFEDRPYGLQKLNLCSFIQSIKGHEQGNSSASIEKLLQRSLKELKRVKDLHQKIVPLRQDSIKGLSLASKFGAGQERGGEFFDLVKGDKECILMMTSSSSYVASSIILSHFEILRNSENLSCELVDQFLGDLYSELRSKSLEIDSENFGILILRVDLGRMKMQGHIFGKFQIVSSTRENIDGNELDFNPDFFEKSFVDRTLNRGEKVLVFSPGMIANLKEKKSDAEISGIFDSLIEKDSKEALHEVFFQVDRLKSGSFFKYDCTALSLEVDQNVIVQI